MIGGIQKLITQRKSNIKKKEQQSISRFIDGVSCFPMWSLSPVSATDGAMMAKAEESCVRISVCMRLIHNHMYIFATFNLAKVKSSK